MAEGLSLLITSRIKGVLRVSATYNHMSSC